MVGWPLMSCGLNFYFYTLYSEDFKKGCYRKKKSGKKTISMRSFKLPIIDSVIFLADAVFPVSDSQMHKSDGP